MTKQQVLDIAGNSINYLGTMASLIYAPANDSNTGAGGAVNGALTGAAAGASLGSVIPGIGTVAGGIIGGVGGFLTSAFKKGKVTTNGFYDDPTMQKGGIFSNNGKLRRRYNWAKDVVQANRAGLVSSELAENNWLQDHDADVMSFANGGVTGSLVYGNDGELVKLPNGDMKQFAELGLPTDSQLAFLPNNTKILNKKDSEQITDRMKKSKNTDKYAQGTDAANKLIASIQFDKAFEKLEADKQRKGIKPKYKQLVPAAEGGLQTGKRYSRKPVRIEADPLGYDVVVNDDGSRTSLEGVAPQNYPKYKYREDPNGKFGFNSDKGEYFWLNPEEEAAYDRQQLDKYGHFGVPGWFSRDILNGLSWIGDKIGDMTKTLISGYEKAGSGTGWPVHSVNTKNSVTSTATTTTNNGKVYPEAVNMYKPFHSYYYAYDEKPILSEKRSPNAGAIFGQLKSQPATTAATQTNFSAVPEGSYSNYSQTTSTPAPATTTSRGTGRKVAVSKPTANTVQPTVAPQVVAPQVETVIDESELTYPRPELEPVLGYTPTIKTPTTDDGTSDDTTSSAGFDWGNLFSSFGSLAPILSGLNAKSEDVRTNYNPYENIILNTMRRRRFNIDPAIQDVNRNRAISRYNMSQMNTNTGANLAYSMQSAVDTNRAIANLRSQESNINNSYLADYANTANSLGQQRVAAENLSADQRAQNRAAADNMIATAGSNLGEWFENQTLMGNLKQRDMEMLPLYSALLNAGTKYADYRSLMENNTRHIRKKNKKGGKKNDSQSV